jgi:hypothetical protein
MIPPRSNNSSWFVFENSTCLIFVSGTNDPWRTSQVVSPLRPGGRQPSTPAQPTLEMLGGFHTSDLVTENGVVNPGCAAVQVQVVSQIMEWVGEYPTKNRSVREEHLAAGEILLYREAWKRL